MSNSDLLQMRSKNEAPEAQALLAKYEHRAFAREESRERPLMSVPIALATPLYALAKAAGLIGARTPPTIGQVGHGLAGAGEGLVGAVKDSLPGPPRVGPPPKSR